MQAARRLQDRGHAEQLATGPDLVPLHLGHELRCHARCGLAPAIAAILRARLARRRGLLCHRELDCDWGVASSRGGGAAVLTGSCENFDLKKIWASVVNLCLDWKRTAGYGLFRSFSGKNNDRKGARRGAGGRPEHKQNSLLTQRKHRVQHVGQSSLLSFSLLGEVLFLVRRLFEQPRLSTSHCSVY